MFNNIQNQRRTHESPMDWEWQTKGPTDPSSPFTHFKPQQQKSNFESSNPQSSFMSNSTPAPAFRNPSFTTPRKPFDQDLFSEASGAESSPADNADAEDTPDLPKSFSAMMTTTKGSEKKPLFGRYGANFQGNSPGQAEQRRGKVANAMMHKLRRRKRIERDYAVIRSRKGSSDSDSDSGPSRPSSKGKNSNDSKPGWFSNILDGIENRPKLPHQLSLYAQLGSNLFLIGLTAFGIYSFWSAIRSDVDKKADEARAEVLAEIAKCAQDYSANNCGRDLRLPALEATCNAWELCMNRDPNSVGRARISAHTFAEIFNSFVEPISYKAMLFTMILVTVMFTVNNLTFSWFRSHTNVAQPQQYYPPPTPSQFQWGPPPQTPSRNIDFGQWGDQGFPAIMPRQTPAQRSPSKGSRSPSKGNRSPSKGSLY